jgi:hypothetical protein
MIPHKVIAISLYMDDIARVDAIVRRFKEKLPGASRSALFRAVLEINEDTLFRIVKENDRDRRTERGGAK